MQKTQTAENLQFRYITILGGFLHFLHFLVCDGFVSRNIHNKGRYLM